MKFRKYLGVYCSQLCGHASVRIRRSANLSGSDVLLQKFTFLSSKIKVLLEYQKHGVRVAIITSDL